MAKTILFIVNDLDFFVSHRMPLAVAAKTAGYDVRVAAPGKGGDARFEAAGIAIERIHLVRGGINPFVDVISLVGLYRLLRRIKPDVAHLITSKPVIYGGLAAKVAGVPVVAAISGLGYAFISSNALLRKIVVNLYRLALSSRAVRVIFQNTDDQRLFAELGIVDAERSVLIPGSGVELDRYPSLPEPDGAPTVVLASRLLLDKGVREFVEAARMLRSRGVEARFRVVGDTDPVNPAAVSPEMIASWKAEGVVELPGHSTGIASEFAGANLVVLPSYREGMPKVLLEAASCGRAVITTDVPGCREAIVPGETGLLVPAKDATALAAAIEELLGDPERRRAMGRAGRALAERRFALKRIVSQHLELYADLAGGNR